MADLINFVRSLIGLGECENADEGTGEMMVDIQLELAISRFCCCRRNAYKNYVASSRSSIK